MLPLPSPLLRLYADITPPPIDFIFADDAYYAAVALFASPHATLLPIITYFAL